MNVAQRIIYRISDGYALRYIACPKRDIELQIQNGESDVPVDAYTDPETVYVSSERLMPREKMPVSFVVERGMVTVTGLPGPATVSCEGESEHSAGEDVTIMVDMPDTYTIRVKTDSPRWLDFEQEVVVP